MPQIDFYILPSPLPAARLEFACKLVEKAWRLGHNIHVHCSDAVQRDALDERLWAFKGESFVPHNSSLDNADAPITLGLADSPGKHVDLLVNLDLKVPGFFERFSRIAEIVVQDPAIRQAARESFRFYRERGYPLQDHRLQRL